MNKKLLLIINPVAGKMKSKTSLFDIVKVFCDNDFDVTVKLTARRSAIGSARYTPIVLSSTKAGTMYISGSRSTNFLTTATMMEENALPRDMKVI